METPSVNSYVATVESFDPPVERAVAETLRANQSLTVVLGDGNRVDLSADDPRSVGYAQVLDAMRVQRRPVYIEIDPETSRIARMFIPHVAQVVQVRRDSDGSVRVELSPSHAVHTLRPDAPGSAALEQRLREAEGTDTVLVVTETDDHEIIDVRAYTPDPEAPPLVFPRMPPRPALPDFRRRPLPLVLLVRLWWWLRWPWWWWYTCVSPARAQQVFDAMAATTCAPLTVPPPCIPFMYPDDGCWGRAHEMCRLMINMGLSPRKVWIQGNLHTPTRNNPNCFVNWGWHVAPTLCVRYWRFPCSQRMVIDPSLFTTPVTEATWKSVQGDPNATLTQSDASDFLWGQTDPTYTATNQVLATYRARLQLRAIQIGPPPYANCP
jgi:hypothetical protein